jgi:type VI secretion system secreted protein Hcp
MAESIWMQVKASKQGDIKSEVTTKGREGMMECVEFESGMSSPRDPASGRPTGRRQHTALAVIKRVDKGSPLLSSALAQNETLTTVKLLFYRPKGDGTTDNFFSIELTNATVSKQKIYLPNMLDPAESHFPALEKIEFTFQKIVWTYTNGGISASDDWEAQS